MTTIVSPSIINGTLAAPASKSSMQRACAAALLHNGITHIHNAGISNDDKAALDIIQQLGATVHFKNDYVEIISNGFGAHVLESKTIICYTYYWRGQFAKTPYGFF
jgi:3-phosphoshikimate 1-carboxyvinyltransferase